jgi:hypothetical protein
MKPQTYRYLWIAARQSIGFQLGYALSDQLTELGLPRSNLPEWFWPISPKATTRSGGAARQNRVAVA